MWAERVVAEGVGLEVDSMFSESLVV
jgi:hypothetical protein